MSTAPIRQGSEEAAAPLLSIRDLHHAFGQRTVLSRVDLELNRPEVLGLLGPNGSGKSTILAVLAGLLPRQGGTLSWEGRPIAGFNRQLRSRLGVVFQSPSLDPKLTARQNLVLAGRLHAVPRGELAGRVEEHLELAGLADRSGDLVKSFSGGMKRRLDLARALLHRPSLLLMDEPTAGLDEAAFRETWSRLEDLRRGRDVSILVATHRPDEAERCDRLAILDAGRIARVLTPSELQAVVSDDVVALRGGDPEQLRDELRATFGLEGLVDGDDVLLVSERGHELIPRLVEGLPDGRLQAVSLRRPTLADAFLRVTGHALDRDLGSAPEGAP